MIPIEFAIIASVAIASVTYGLGHRAGTRAVLRWWSRLLAEPDETPITTTNQIKR